MSNLRLKITILMNSKKKKQLYDISKINKNNYMIYQKPKTNIYKQLQNAIYLLRIYIKKIEIFYKLSKKVMGFIVEKLWGL
jgi:hypothetical protein